MVGMSWKMGNNTGMSKKGSCWKYEGKGKGKGKVCAGVCSPKCIGATSLVLVDTGNRQ